jgi:hypothetical protein
LEDVLITIAKKDLSCQERLKQVLFGILECCMSNKKLFNVVLLYLLQLQKKGKNPGEKVKRRIIRLRHLLTSILIDGIKAGEFKKIDVKAANDLFYSLLESAVFRLSILDQNDLSEFDRTIELAVANISV